MALKQISDYYKVPAENGRRIRFEGKEGVIVGCHAAYIKVNFDHDKPNVYVNLHPTWNVEYLGVGKVRKLTKSQERYQRYLQLSDVYQFDNFMHFCRWDTYERLKELTE